MFDQMAKQDFERAFNRATWRRILGRLTGAGSQLLPYDEVRARLPLRGQHYIGLQQVPIEKIIGSMGRYNDFDRAFLPTQKRTMERWINIDKAHYADVILPPVELIKIGEVYFVKDGNHRVSVANERGQKEVDAYVTEIDIPFELTPEMKFDELELKSARAKFLAQIPLEDSLPDVDIQPTIPQVYPMLVEHIETHRWYLGVEKRSEASLGEAVTSWYAYVYLPLVELIREQGLLKSFPKLSEADLYMWVMEYHKYMRLAYYSEKGDEEIARAIAAQQLIRDFPQPDVGKLIDLVNHTQSLDKIVLDQEQAKFQEETKILELRADALILTSMPGQYARLLDHIATHRWYLGENEKVEISYPDAVTSWYDNVYMPIVQIIRDQDVLKEFPNRTETDLYLWIVKHQWYLKETYGGEITIQRAADEVLVQHARSKLSSLLQKLSQRAAEILHREH